MDRPGAMFRAYLVTKAAVTDYSIVFRPASISSGLTQRTPFSYPAVHEKTRP